VSTVNGEQSFLALLKRGCIDAANGVVTRSNPSSSSIDEDEGFFIVLIYFFGDSQIKYPGSVFLRMERGIYL
jgi:hypothetical protein